MKNLLSAGGRKTLAVITGSMNTRYDFDLVRGIRAAATINNFNLLNLVCGSMDSTNVFSYEFEYNQLYYLINTHSVDGLILMPSLISNYSTKERLNEVLARLPGLPMVTIGEPIPGFPGVFVDNQKGIRDIVRHLHRDHGRRRIAFISGPPNNQESQDRLQGYRLGLADCALAFDPNYVHEGNFWINGGKAGAGHFFGGNFLPPDAIVCSNDYTAQGVYEKLKELGISIPREVAVTGFDNLYAVEFYNPPLTSITQPFEAMAAWAVASLAAIIRGEDLALRTVMPSAMVFRRSCGCDGRGGANPPDRELRAIFGQTALAVEIASWIDELEAALEQKHFPVRDFLDNIQELMFRSIDLEIDFPLWHSFFGALTYHLLKSAPSVEGKNLRSQFLVDMQETIVSANRLQNGLAEGKKNDFDILQSRVIRRLINVFSLKGFWENLSEELPKLGVNSFFMVGYAKPFTHAFKDAWFHPTRSKFLFGYQPGKTMLPSTLKAGFKTWQLLPDGIGFLDRPYVFNIIGLFFRETQFGYMIFEAGVDDQHMYHDLATQISSTYNSILIFEEREAQARELKRTMKQLLRSNRKLNEISTRDALTGLYNRRGFIMLGEKFHDLALRDGNNYVLFFADMDGLKRINDTWGHSEGDAAIAACAKLLTETFRASDVIARLGGDEFTVLSANSAKETIPGILLRLKDAIAKHNRNSGKPYSLAISVGEVLFSDNPGLSFPEIMEKADSILYQRKKARKFPL